MVFIYDCNLNIDGFIHMLDDPTECYKFYWLDAIMQLIAQGKTEFTFDEIVSGMIADAWYSVSVCHLKMGTKDKNGNSANSIERAIVKLCEQQNQQSALANRMEVLSFLIDNNSIIKEQKMQIIKNVPYRLLSSFIPEIGGNDSIWDNKTRLISYYDLINREKCLPYTFGSESGLNRKILIDKRWLSFLRDNLVSIRGCVFCKPFLQKVAK